MNLIPFNSIFGEQIQKYYLLPQYSHFARGMRHYLTLEECQHLPQILGREVLIICDNQKMIGMIALKEEVLNVTNFSIVLDSTEQKKGIGYEALEAIESYCFNIRGDRIVMTEIVSSDSWLKNGLLKKGYTYCGSIPGYNIVNGEEKDVSIFFKRK